MHMVYDTGLGGIYAGHPALSGKTSHAAQSQHWQSWQSPACRTVRTAALLSQAILTKGFQVSSQAQTWLFAEINIGTWNAELT